MSRTSPKTRLIHARAGGRRIPTVNPPVERASTLLLPDADALYDDLIYEDQPNYGRMGLSVHRELEGALCELEGAAGARLAPSGLAACTLALSGLLRAGDHVLVSDSVYGPTRRFCNLRLKAMGVEADFFPPRIGNGIETRFKPNTKAVFLEAPGSLTFEISDTPAIVAVAQARGAYTLIDNTWGAGVFHRPLELGVDVSIQALTKYVVGHSDYFGGAILSRTPGVAAKMVNVMEQFGVALGPEEAYASLRGLRTLHTRLAAHDAASREVAHWLADQSDVSRVLHPALEQHPDHTIWVRDFRGACGLFGVVLEATPKPAFDAFLRGFELFGFGYSWGGFESLILPCDPQLRRMAGDWTADKPGPLLRLHIGLEDPADLIADLDAAFERRRAAL